MWVGVHRSLTGGHIKVVTTWAFLFFTEKTKKKRTRFTTLTSNNWTHTLHHHVVIMVCFPFNANFKFKLKFKVDSLSILQYTHMHALEFCFWAAYSVRIACREQESKKSIKSHFSYFFSWMFFFFFLMAALIEVNLSWCPKNQKNVPHSSVRHPGCPSTATPEWRSDHALEWFDAVQQRQQREEDRGGEQTGE